MQPVSEISHIIQSDKLLVKMPSSKIIKEELRWYSRYFSNHLLHQSAKWCSELLMGVTSDQEIQNVFLLRTFVQNNLDSSYSFVLPHVREDPEVQDLITLVKTLFNLRQYKKCTDILQKHLHRSSCQSVIFFYYYSKWMTYQIRKQEQVFQNQGQIRNQANPQIVLLSAKFKQMYDSGLLKDITLYLYGLLLKQQQKLQQAKKIFLEVLNTFPCFWSCWIELSKIIINDDIKNLIVDLKDHWMKNFFFSSFCLQKYKNNISTEINYGLFCFFKDSTYLMNQIAHCFYNNQEFDVSLEWFEKLVQVDQYRVQNMDIYSNILYIKEKQGELANLAVRCFYNNKYTPQTCCVVGNYYSLIGEHLKAISYFRKALKLDKNCLGAWTLMGHECLEMKNIPGAIQAYRSAVEIDPKDFRAWYGLGQTYELQKMNNYALYYFTKAVMSRPKDARMWNAMASCYETMDKRAQASKCYQRAENCKDRQGIAIHQLAKLYSIMGSQFQSKAVEAFQLNLRRKDEESVTDRQVGECLLFLAKYYTRIGKYERATQLVNRLHDFEGPQRDEVNSLFYQLKQKEKKPQQ